MTTATRERKLQFIRDAGIGALYHAVDKAIVKYGADWLTDEQLDSIVADEIAEQRAAQRRNRQNRQEAESRADERRSRLRTRAAELKKHMQCNCDLDNWEPEASTGHSWVCRIHKAAMSSTSLQIEDTQS